MPPTGYQLAAARALLGLERKALAEIAKVSEEAIARLEAAPAGTPDSAAPALHAVKAALEAAGVEFLNHGQPGVRRRASAGGGASIAIEDLTSANDE